MSEMAHCIYQINNIVVVSLSLDLIRSHYFSKLSGLKTVHSGETFLQLYLAMDVIRLLVK